MSVNRAGDAIGEVSLSIYGSNAGRSDITNAGVVNVGSSSDLGIYTINCTNSIGALTYTQVLVDGTPTSPISVRDQVRASLEIPVPQPNGSPPLTERFSVVHIPTWFWVDNYEPITASDTLDGLAVTVTATPTGVTWNPGDGNPPVTCNDGGLPWDSSRDEDDTNCSHTYTRSTAGQPGNALTITTTMGWDLTWTLNDINQGSFEPSKPSPKPPTKSARSKSSPPPTPTNETEPASENRTR